MHDGFPPKKSLICRLHRARASAVISPCEDRRLARGALILKGGIPLICGNCDEMLLNAEFVIGPGTIFQERQPVLWTSARAE
jgi:hypothetical protein